MAIRSLQQALIYEDDREIQELLDGYQCVYCIQCTKTGDVKIGYTKDIEARLTQLQVGSPTKLRCIFQQFTEDAPGLEAALHKHWKQYQTHGEWFRIPQEMLDAWMDSIGGGSHHMQGYL